MDRENRSDERNTPEEEYRPPTEEGPVHSTRTWRACCLAPAIAVVILLLLTAVAELFSPQSRQPQVSNGGDPARRAAFIEFGRDFFAIARRADAASEAAFKELESMGRGSGSLDAVHTGFATAAQANATAAREYRELAIPDNLVSQSRIKQSLDTMSESYDARRRACEVIVGWNGDANDQETADEYRALVENINQLTREGLEYLGSAADDNGLTREDVQKFLPAASLLKAHTFGADAIPPD